MIPVTYPSSVSTSKESQMVVFALSSVAGLQRWTDYIPVKYQSTGSDVPNSFNTNGYIACDFITNLTGKQAWVDYIPVFVDNLATTAWQVSDTGFIPFNTLAGGGTYVSLDLNFLNTTALDSRITFSRGTNATLTDSNGRIAWAPHNLLTNSEDFEAAAWTKATATVTTNLAAAPDGTTTADRLNVATSGGLDQSVSLTTGISYTISIWAKSNGGSKDNFALYGDGTQTSATLTATNVWQRFSYTFTSANTGSRGNGIVASGGSGTDILIWGAQLNVGSTAQSYNSTTPKNLLGFTQEPENAAWTKSNSYVQQNLLTWSQDFDNAAWGRTNVTPTANTEVAPDGSTTADTLSDGLAAGLHYLESASQTLTGAYTASVYAKKGTSNFIGVYAQGISQGAFFNLNTGQFTSNIVGAPTSYSITSVGNGWYRVSITFSAATVAVNYRLFTSNDGTTFNYTGNNNTVFIWGAQLVQGSTAGDYTQTTSAAAPTRYLNYDGTLTGRKLVEDTANNIHQAYVAYSFVVNGVYGWSLYAKAGERSWVWINAQDGTDRRTWFNLANGTVGTNAAGNTANITSVGGGWYRCSINRTAAAASGYFAFGVTNADNTVITPGDGTSGIYVSDFQLSNSASVDPYVYNPQAAAASAAYYGPRFDYDPVTLASRGLLIEEQRTNLLTYSEDFTNVVWNKSNASVTANAAVSPDGTTNADKLVENTATSTHTVSVTLIAGSAVYTYSVYVKAAGRSVIRFRDSVNGVDGYFDLTTASSPSGTAVNRTITDVGNGWYRCSMTSSAAVTNPEFGVRLATAVGIENYTGDGVSGVFLYGSQVEAGSFATSYIPTVASQVTRNADSASMLGDNFYTWYNPNQGTFYNEWNITTAISSATFIDVSDGTSNNRFNVQPNTGGTTRHLGFVSGSALIVMDIAGAGTGTAKDAFAYIPSSHAASRNGSAVATSTYAGVPGGINTMRIGSVAVNAGVLNGTIRSIRYYNTRLPDSTLQALTT